MRKIYELSCNVDIMGQPRITASKGRYSTSDPRIHRILSVYPGVRLIATEPDEPALRPGPGTPVEPVVVSGGGLQTKPRREQGGRVTGER